MNEWFGMIVAYGTVLSLMFAAAALLLLIAGFVHGVFWCYDRLVKGDE